MLRLTALLLLCSCATVKPSAPVRGEECEREYDVCNNTCFASPNYRRNGPQCTQTELFQICPQENQLIDTVATAKCFERCEWDVSLCTPPPAPALEIAAPPAELTPPL